MSMRNAYALLGLSFLIVFGGAYVIFERAYAPELREEQLSVDARNAMSSLTLTSSAFPHNGSIPSVYTCDGVNTLPPLTVSGMPKGTETLVVLMDDPYIPETIKASRGVQKIDHFGRYNIPADTAVIEDASGDPVLNSRGEEGFIGPCPPPEYEPKEHRYIFRLYALPERLSFNGVPSLDEVEAAAKERAIASAELIGRYQRE